MLTLVAAQMLVFNHIHLFGYATPMVCVYMLFLFPLGTRRWTVMLWGFVCGLLADVVSLTPGVTAASMTVAAFLQPLLLKAMEPQNAAEDMQASFHTLGFWVYVRYAAILTTIFMASYCMVLAFSFFHISDMILTFLGSWVLTMLVCLAIEGVRGRRRVV